MIWIFKNRLGEYILFKSRGKKKSILTLCGGYSLDDIIKYAKEKLNRKAMRIYFYDGFAGAVAYQRIQQRNKFKLKFCYDRQRIEERRIVCQSLDISNVN